jgi:hypothetical protein
MDDILYFGDTFMRWEFSSNKVVMINIDGWNRIVDGIVSFSGRFARKHIESLETRQLLGGRVQPLPPPWVFISTIFSNLLALEHCSCEGWCHLWWH